MLIHCRYKSTVAKLTTTDIPVDTLKLFFFVFCKIFTTMKNVSNKNHRIITAIKSRIR
jgi:hypothetical protein